ncbi:hypothetical protein L917_07107 [Phytophthora nicotianae]|uniref:Uncharacterized protein n=1 Tax=Phytophthora nicotianae TaxID=4792 RepID=W2LE73_PHYNI|nr:hypothetical protein L917_07107 [Phytophthora nicotianae]
MPTMTISSRWNMTDTLKVYRKFEVGAASLQSVTSSIRLKNTARADKDTCATLSNKSSVSTIKVEHTPRAHVAYLRLRRQESGNVVMMSSEEKYSLAKIVFDPVFTRL